MVTDTELVSRLHEILSTSDLETTTTGSLRRKLEEELGITLSHKKSFIRQQVDLYLQSHFQQQQDPQQEDQQDPGKQEQDPEEEQHQDPEKEDQQEQEETEQEEQEEQEQEQEQEEQEEEEQEEEELSGNEKAPLVRTTRTTRYKQKKKVKRKGGGGGFQKVCGLSPLLQKITGVSELPRTEVAKQIWGYIREKNLQDPADKRNINCDGALRDLFNVDSINMFQMNKALAKHIWPLDSNGKEQEGEAEEADEEGSGDGNGKAKATATKRSKKQDKNVKGKGNGGGFNKVCSLSPELQNFTGVPELARTEVVKRIWSYIRENDLQDPSDRRNINCDDALRVLFNVDSINMFQMNKALAKHIWPLDSDASVNTTPKEKQLKDEREDPDEPKRKEKRQKRCNTEDLATIPLSEALVKFLGTGETSLAPSDVIKRIWEYIDHNNLQDPFDTGRIIADEKLKELFEVDAFNGLNVTKLLKIHFVKDEK